MKKKTVTLSQWLIEQNDTEAYRAGKLAGKKHPKVDQKLIDAVGGMQNLIRQARVLEQDEALGKSGMIQFRWCNLGSDISQIDYEVAAIPLLCRQLGVKDVREHQAELITRVQMWKNKVSECEWVENYYDTLLSRLTLGKKVSEAEDEKLFLCLNAVAAQQEFIWERVFSVRVFHNSKTFQNEYKNSIVTILKNYSPYYEEEIDAEMLLAALAGIGAAIGIGIAFFKKKQHTLDDNSEFSDDFEDEDFDLDSDLEPVTQRSYVSLNQETEETPAEEETSSEQDAEV